MIIDLTPGLWMIGPGIFFMIAVLTSLLGLVDWICYRYIDSDK